MSSSLLRLKHELGATMKTCIVRCHPLKILRCGGMPGVSGGGVNQTCIVTAGNMQYNKGGPYIRKRVPFCCRERGLSLWPVAFLTGLRVLGRVGLFPDWARGGGY